MNAPKMPYYSQMMSFRKDIDEIARDLIDAFKLKFSEKNKNTNSPLFRWLDFRSRYIDPKPRKTLKPDGFDARIPIEAVSALSDFIKQSEAGDNLNSYQSTTIKRNDSSAMKPQFRTDGLWADWGIHHVHLTESPSSSGEEFPARSDWLLFFLVFSNQLALIDIRRHDEPNIFAAHDLVEKAIRSWPEFAAECRIKGMQTEPISTTFEAVNFFRHAGAIRIVKVDDHAYLPPGFGFSAAATPVKVGLQEDHVIRLAYSIVKFFITLMEKGYRWQQRKVF